MRVDAMGVSSDLKGVICQIPFMQKLGGLR